MTMTVADALRFRELHAVFGSRDSTCFACSAVLGGCKNAGTEWLREKLGSLEAARLAGWRESEFSVTWINPCDEHRKPLYPWIADVPLSAIRDYLQRESEKSDGAPFLIDFAHLKSFVTSGRGFEFL